MLHFEMGVWGEKKICSGFIIYRQAILLFWSLTRFVSFLSLGGVYIEDDCG